MMCKFQFENRTLNFRKENKTFFSTDKQRKYNLIKCYAMGCRMHDIFVKWNDFRFYRKNSANEKFTPLRLQYTLCHYIRTSNKILHKYSKTLSQLPFKICVYTT